MVIFHSYVSLPEGGTSPKRHDRADRLTCRSNGSPSAASPAPVAAAWRRETAACPDCEMRCGLGRVVGILFIPGYFIYNIYIYVCVYMYMYMHMYMYNISIIYILFIINIPIDSASYIYICLFI